MTKANTTTALINLDVLDKNIQKVKPDVSFSLKHEIKSLKKSGKLTEGQIHDFLGCKAFSFYAMQPSLRKKPT